MEYFRTKFVSFPFFQNLIFDKINRDVCLKGFEIYVFQVISSFSFTVSSNNSIRPQLLSEGIKTLKNASIKKKSSQIM